MSLQNDGVWKGGVWAATVWTQNVWYENTTPGPTINYQGDGITRRKKRRNRTYELFADIERTLRSEIYGKEIPSVELGIVATVGTANAAYEHVESSLDAALRELTRVSHGYADLSARVAEIRAEVATYEARSKREIDDDDEEFLLLT